MPCHFLSPYFLSPITLLRSTIPPGYTEPTLLKAQVIFACVFQVRPPSTSSLVSPPEIEYPIRTSRALPISEPAHDTGRRDYQSPRCMGARRLCGRIRIANATPRMRFTPWVESLSSLYDIAVSDSCTPRDVLLSFMSVPFGSDQDAKLEQSRSEEREPNIIGSMSVRDHTRTLLRLERF